ncbi:signal recognition particle, SRP9/SRP14 subunit [Spinellus fusiger]|nr:signal recognition particle, SRP9/SRP14 subunit [Spinellus fusiger]
MRELDPIAFTVELGKLYEQSKTTGTVAVTIKRMTHARLKKVLQIKKNLPKGGSHVMENEGPTVEYPCLIRAAYKQTKISTTVSVDEFSKFQAAYSTIIRAYMDTLKKKERVKKAKKLKT